MKKYKGMPAVNNDWQGYTKSENFRPAKNQLVYVDEIFIYAAVLICWFNYLLAKIKEVERGVLSPDGFINAMVLATIIGLILFAGIFVNIRRGINR